NWRSYPAPPDLQRIGDEGARTGASAVLQVPSAVIATDSNYLLNPRHPDFRSIRTLRARAFDLDPRLSKEEGRPGSQISTAPVLLPMLSAGTSSVCSIASSRLAIGVCGL